jgi:hypothetical protein
MARDAKVTADQDAAEVLEEAQAPARHPLGGFEQTGHSGFNAGSKANAFEVQVTDPIEGGKEKTGLQGQNAGSAAATYEARCVQGGTTH